MSQPGIATLALLLLLSGYGLYRLVKACDGANTVDWGARWMNRLDGLNRLFCHRYHRLDYTPLSLPDAGPALVVSNHVSGLDPLLLIAASNRPLRFIIAAEQYHRFGLRWLFRAVGCIPVDRRGRPERAFREALKALKDGEVIALFPHGKIHLDSEPSRPLKSGAVKLAQMAACPVYPVRIDGVRGEGYVVSAVFMRSRARVHNLAPFRCDNGQLGVCLGQIEKAITVPPESV